MKPSDAPSGWRATATACDRAADWLDRLAAGRRVDDNGPIPLHLARNVPVALLRQWANNERARALLIRSAATDRIPGRTRP